MSTSWSIPRETVEWIGPVTVPTGATNIELALVPRGTRPTSEWAAPMLDDGKPGHLATGLTPGEYHLWVRYTDGPETPVHASVGVIKVN